jgi:hypothetical protein
LIALIGIGVGKSRSDELRWMTSVKADLNNIYRALPHKLLSLGSPAGDHAPWLDFIRSFPVE